MKAKLKIIILLTLSITFAYPPVYSQDTVPETVQEDTTVTTTPAPTPDVSQVFGQDTVPVPNDGNGGGLKERFTVDNLLNWYTILTAALMSLVTFLTGLFPKFTFIKDDRKRDLALKSLASAILVGATMIVVGGASGWDVAIGFVLAVFGYDKVLNPMGLKTKTAAEKK